MLQYASKKLAERKGRNLLRHRADFSCPGPIDQGRESTATRLGPAPNSSSNVACPTQRASYRRRTRAVNPHPRACSHGANRIADTQRHNRAAEASPQKVMEALPPTCMAY